MFMVGGKWKQLVTRFYEQPFVVDRRENMFEFAKFYSLQMKFID